MVPSGSYPRNLRVGPGHCTRERHEARVTFEDAASVFLDRSASTEEEDRPIMVGRSTRERTPFVAHALRRRRARFIGSIS